MKQSPQQAVPTFTILVVDDEKPLLDSVLASLAEAGITNVIPVIDAARVAPLMDENNVGLILLDLTMPNLSGEEIMRACRESHPDTAVIIISGNKDIDRAVSCMKSGALDYLSKPLNPDLLVSSVRRVIADQDTIRENLLPTIRNMVDLLIQEALRRSNGHQARAAHTLGISPQALSKRLKGDRNTGSRAPFARERVWGENKNG